MKQFLPLLFLQYIANSRSVEITDFKEPEGCSFLDLPSYRNISCIDASNNPITAKNGITSDAICKFTCLNGVKTWAYCGKSGWKLHNKDCASQDEGTDIKHQHIRKKRFFRFIRRIVRGIKCFFSRCRRPRPRDRTPPSLRCPDSKTESSDKFQTNTKVWWSVPKAYDDRDGHVSTYSLYGHYPGQLFGEGSTTIGYYARDKSGNMARCYFTVTVKVTRCPKVHRVQNGYVICHPSVDMVRGAVCRYGCYRGHELKGTSYSVCNDAGRWTGWTIVQPFCEKKTCPTLISAGKLSVTCSDDNRFRSICTYSCPDGYDIPAEDSRVRICQYDGSWSGKDTFCKDIRRPEFTHCPAGHTFYIPKFQDNVTVYWKLPEVEDNSGADIQATQINGPLPYTVQSVGVYNLIFTATDAVGNTARNCLVKLIIKQIRCFMVYPTPYTGVNCTGNTYGSTCRFGCTNDAELLGDHVVTCERQGDPPYGYWTWGESQPSCHLTEKCPSLAAPKYGALSCDIWVGGKFCQMQCKEGYDVPRHFPGLSVCTDDGEWFPSDNIQDCRKSSQSRKVKTEIDIYYYSGSCSDETTKAQIKKNFIEIFQQSNFNKLCKSQDGCYWQLVKVICGDGGRKREAADTIVKAEIVYESEVINESSFKQIYKNHTKHLGLLADDISEGKLNLNLGNETLQATKVKKNSLNLDCTNNTVASLSTFSCVKCTSGSHYKPLMDVCEDCPRGTYQPDTGQSECTKCPERTSTANVGAISIDECLAACPPGSWSATSILPCIPCDVGTYQSEYGATKCLECDVAQITNDEQSTSKTQCKEFDITFPENQTLGSYLVLQKPILLDGFSLTARFQCAQQCNGTLIKIMEADSSLINIELREKVIFSVKSSISKTENTWAMDKQWHSMVVVMTSTRALLYLDSNEVFSSSYGAGGVFNITRIEIGEAYQGIISQINIFSNKTSIQELKSFSDKCINIVGGDVMGWKSFKDAVLNNAFIQIPSQCDDFNECLSSPCINGTCTDELLSYTCSCHAGFTGQNCDVNIDDCAVNSCQNNATCIDDVSNYTCECQQLFTGEFCEIEQVDGSWSEWGNWSECSVTCGNGSVTRVRVCDNPSPDNGGKECQGNDTEIDDCILESCKVCSNLTEPENSFLNCTDTGDARVCTLTCYEGYEFDQAPPEFYMCSNETAHLWDFKTDDNANTALPSCSATEDGEKIDFIHTASYDNLQCTETVNPTEIITSIVKTAVKNLTCIKDEICTQTQLSVTNCNVGIQKRDTSSTAGFSVALQCLPKDHGTETCYEALNMAASELQALENNGTMTVTVNGVDYLIDTNTSYFNDVLTCPLGSVAVYAYCVPCAPGRYFVNELCELCDYGYYQDQFKQTSCKPCPPGLSTLGTGSTNETDCNVPRSIVKETKNSEELETNTVAIVCGTVVSVVFLGTVIAVLVYKYKLKIRKVDPVALRLQNGKPDLNRKIMYVRELSVSSIFSTDTSASSTDISVM